MANVTMIINEKAGSYGASFPDFPGTFASAKDLDALYAQAAEVLAIHVAGTIEDGAEPWKLRSLDEWRKDEDFIAESAGAMIGLVRVDLPGKSLRVNITIDEGLLKRVDRAAERTGESRSGFLAQAAKARLGASL